MEDAKPFLQLKAEQIVSCLIYLSELYNPGVSEIR